MKKIFSFQSSVVLCLVVATVACILLGSLGVVQIRGKVAKVAAQTKILEQELLQLERKDQHFKARLAELRHPNYLKGRIAGNLHMPQKESIIWAEKMALKAPTIQKAGNRLKPSEPFTIALDLAFLH
jgi:hypothetical protein